MLGIWRTRVRQIPGRSAGFTMIEMAVAIVVIAILLGGILVPLQTQVESRKIEETNRLLDQAREALLGYASAYGYFPCPASGTSNGQQATGAGHPGTGTCAAAVTGANSWIGFLPAATLGFTRTDANGYAVDAWGLTQNRIRYAVSNWNANTLTKTAGMKTAGMSSVAGALLLYVCNSGTGVVAGTNCGTAVTLSSNAIAVIWSVGPNAPTGGASVHEAQNPNPNGGSSDRLFVSRQKSGAAGAEFDDQLTWIGSSPLFNRLIAAGQLP